MLALHSRRVRTYSTECASANEVLLQMASQGQLSLLFGVWLDNRPTDQKEIEDLLVYLRKYPNADLYGIAVGNEAVFRGTLQPYEVAAKITEVRNRVRALGQELGSSHSVLYSVNLTANYDLLVQIINSKRCALFFALGQQSNRGVESCQKWNY